MSNPTLEELVDAFRAHETEKMELEAEAARKKKVDYESRTAKCLEMCQAFEKDVRKVLAPLADLLQVQETKRQTSEVLFYVAVRGKIQPYIRGGVYYMITHDGGEEKIQYVYHLQLPDLIRVSYKGSRDVHAHTLLLPLCEYVGRIVARRDAK